MKLNSGGKELSQKIASSGAGNRLVVSLLIVAIYTKEEPLWKDIPDDYYPRDCKFKARWH
jgi:hypothetical protein